MQLRNAQTNAPAFTKIASVPDGHSFWRDEQGRIAVADGSMRVEGRPETVDGGLLYLDFSRPVVMGADRTEPASIPLMTPKGEPRATVGPGAEAIFLGGLGMEIREHDGRVSKAASLEAMTRPTGLRGEVSAPRAAVDLANRLQERRIRFFDIQYDTDREDGSPVQTQEELGIPSELLLDVEPDFDVDEHGADLISEKTGWLVLKFQSEEVGEACAQRVSPTLKSEGLQAMLEVQSRFEVGQRVEILLEGGKVQEGVVAGFGHTSNVYDLSVYKALGVVLVDLGQDGFYSPGKALFNRLLPVAPEYLRAKEVSE